MTKKAKVFLLLLSLVALISINASGQNNQFRYASPPPLTRPSNAGVSVMFVDTIEKKVYTFPKVTERREVLNSGWFTKGDPGKDGTNGTDGLPGAPGAAGAAGVCPPCPPSSGGGTMTIPSFWAIRFVSTWDEYLQARQLAMRGSVRSIQLTQSITQTSKVRWSDTPDNPSFSLTVQGNNNRITIADGIDTANVRSFNDLNSATKKIDFQIHFESVEFSAPKSCIINYLSSCYQTSFYKCKFFGGRIAIDAQFVLQGTVRECRFSDWGYVAVNLDYDKFTGGNNYSSQSNHWLLEQNNFRSPNYSATNNAFACVRSFGNSGLVCFHDIYEGGDWNNNNKGCDYGVWADDNGSTVVKIPVVTIDCHGEFTPAKALFYSKQNSGVSKFIRPFMQKPGVLIEYESANYGRCIVEEIPYVMPNYQNTFKNSGAGGKWYFNNVPAEINVYATTSWTGTKPQDKDIFCIPCINADGQKAEIILGGKKVLLQQ